MKMSIMIQYLPLTNASFSNHIKLLTLLNLFLFFFNNDRHM